MLPGLYSKTTKRYPLIISVHSAGEPDKTLFARFLSGDKVQSVTDFTKSEIQG